MAITITKVISATNRGVVVQASDGNTYTLTGARSQRNNNPGAIAYSPVARAFGAIGQDTVSVNGQPSTHLAIFPTMEAGQAAQQELLFGNATNHPQYGSMTIGQVIARYAPGGVDGNGPSSAYAQRIANSLGVSASTPMADLTPAQQSAFMQVQAGIESGGRGQIVTDQRGNVVQFPPANIPNVQLPPNSSGGPDDRSLGGQWPHNYTPIPLAPLPPLPQSNLNSDAATSLAFNPMGPSNATPALGSFNSDYPQMDALYPASMTAGSGAIPLGPITAPNASGSPDDRSTPYLAPGYNSLPESLRNAMLAVPSTPHDLLSVLGAEPAQPTGYTIPDPTYGNSPYTTTFPPASTMLGGMSKQTPPAALQGVANALGGLSSWLAPVSSPPPVPSASPSNANSPSSWASSYLAANLPALPTYGTSSQGVPPDQRGNTSYPSSAPSIPQQSYIAPPQTGGRSPTERDEASSMPGNIPTTSYISGTAQLPSGARPSSVPAYDGGWGSYMAPVASSVPQATTRQVTQQVQQINPAYTAWMNNQTPVASSPFSNPGVQGLSPDDRDSPIGIAGPVPGLTSSAFNTPAPPKYITVPKLVTVPVPGVAPVVPANIDPDYLAYLRQQAENPFQKFYEGTPLGHITGFLGGLFNPDAGTTFGAPKQGGLLGMLSGAFGSHPGGLLGMTSTPDQIKSLYAGLTPTQIANSNPDYLTALSRGQSSYSPASIPGLTIPTTTISGGYRNSGGDSGGGSPYSSNGSLVSSIGL